MAASISSQVLDEVRELRKDVHGIDIKLAEHLAQDIEHVRAVDKLKKAVFGNGCHGLDDRVDDIETQLREKKQDAVVDKKFKLDIKSGAIVGGITLAMSVLAQILMAKVF